MTLKLEGSTFANILDVGEPKRIITSLTPEELIDGQTANLSDMTPNSALIPDAFSLLRCGCGAAKREG